jgi:hypothetical protein
MKYYYFDDTGYFACGPFDTAEQAKAEAQDNTPHTREVTILQVWGVSKPPSLKRTWRW